MTNLTLPRTFDPHLNIQEIVLVGCGGTGSHLARLIARLLVHLRTLRLALPILRIIDPDIVEAANVGRQLYTPAELGMPKAEATARRLSCALGLAVEWASVPFSAGRHLGTRYNTLVIEAVDNHTARQELAQFEQICLIACGNERTHGQVSIGNTSDPVEMLRYLDEVEQRESKLGEKDSLRLLPTAYALFPSLLDPEPNITPEVEDTLSCAELVLMGEQDLYVNDTIALIAARYVQQLLLRQPVQSFLTFCTLEETLTVKPVPTTMANLRAYL